MFSDLLSTREVKTASGVNTKHVLIRFFQDYFGLLLAPSRWHLQILETERREES